MPSSGTATLSTQEDALTLKLDIDDASTVFYIDVTSTPTVTFEGSANGDDWVAVEAENLSDGVQATTATADGLYLVPCAGLHSVRARASTLVSGEAVDATARSSTAAPHWS